MKTKYLTGLADYLENIVDRKDFDLSDWECGTKMCAGGYATKVFKRLGLKMVDGSIYFNGWKNYKALEHFFQISEEKAFYIFCPLSYKSFTNKREVITRIRKMVK